MLARPIANIPIDAAERAPPHMRNCSEGALYAIPARDVMESPVARAASAMAAEVDIWIRGNMDRPMTPVKAV